jgi:RNA polymerase sporulation-specific sigma factor
MLKQKVKKLFVRIITIIGGNTKKELYYISGAETLPPPLTAKEENEILEKLLNNDESVRKILVERNLRLVVYIAKKFENTSCRNRRFNINWNYRFNESNNNI